MCRRCPDTIHLVLLQILLKCALGEVGSPIRVHGSRKTKTWHQSRSEKVQNILTCCGRVRLCEDEAGEVVDDDQYVLVPILRHWCNRADPIHTDEIEWLKGENWSYIGMEEEERYVDTRHTYEYAGRSPPPESATNACR